MGWKRELHGLGVALVIVIAFAFYNNYPDIREQLGITVGLIIIAIVLFVYINHVRNDLSKTSYADEKWVEALMAGEPIKPTRIKPEEIPHDYGGISKENFTFYRDFEEFGRMLNDWFQELNIAWRLQERERASVSMLADDSLVYGRNYSIHYNRPSVGQLEITSEYEYSHEKPEIRAILELRNPRVFPLDEIISLHEGLAHHLCNDTPEAANRSFRELQLSMIQVMWSVEPDTTINPKLEVGMSGNASTYLRRLERLKRKGP